MLIDPDNSAVRRVTALQYNPDTLSRTQGGRLYGQMTDVDPEDVRVGDEVVLTLRRRKEGPTMHHYYWKCRPLD